MAACGKQFFLTLFNNTNKNNVVLVRLGNNFRPHLSVVHCSTPQAPKNQKLSKAMRSYLERSVQYDNFLREQLNEYNMGKKFLASMMGKKGEMTQKEIDEAIEYLFPSGLFVPKSRPMMKPPEEIFAKQKPVAFDNTGRPFHFLFYTVKPNYSQCLHDAATHLMRLNEHEDKMRKSREAAPAKKLILVGNWMTKEELERKWHEKLYTIEYTKFTEVFNRLAQHPYAFLAEDFIIQYWIAAVTEKESEIPKPGCLEDGTQTLTVLEAKRKTSLADVKLTYPGSGQIRINGLGLDYFLDIQSREQPDHCPLESDSKQLMNYVTNITDFVGIWLSNDSPPSKNGLFSLQVEICVHSNKLSHCTFPKDVDCASLRVTNYFKLLNSLVEFCSGEVKADEDTFGSPRSGGMTESVHRFKHSY